MSVLDEADAYVVRNGINLPEEPDAHKIDPNPKCVTHPILKLNLASDGITSIIWATGYHVEADGTQHLGATCIDENVLAGQTQP